MGAFSRRLSPLVIPFQIGSPKKINPPARENFK
jgi:hypothetical protein